MLEKIRRILGPRLFIKLIHLWPPFWGTGIRVSFVSIHLDEIRVFMKRSTFNTNHIGSHFGGSLYMMIDPFYMLILQHRLGSGYGVADREGRISYVKPAKGTVRSTIKLRDGEIEEITGALEQQASITRTIELSLISEGETVATASKTVSITKRGAKTRSVC